MKKIAYSFLIGDLFHYGHLKMLEKAKISSDYHICGIISDKVAKKWLSSIICSYDEREAVIASNINVDETYYQDSLDPSENLKKIRKKYPEAKLFLIQSHILGGVTTPGLDYINEINGEYVTHDFYSNLSRDYIGQFFFKEYVRKRKLRKFSFDNIKIEDKDFWKKNFSTKANTLINLKSKLKHSIIEKELVFTVDEWKEKKKEIIRNIRELFISSRIVVRSSSIDEDSVDLSNAGCYESILDIDSKDDNLVKSAINRVIESYIKKNNYSGNNQILVQKQTENLVMSGVLFTRNLWTNTPYYLINYDKSTEKTNVVTSGLSSEKVEILKDINITNVEKKWENLIIAVREIESVSRGITLDIEFAINSSGKIILFQVRPLAANSKFYSLDDDLINEKIVNCQEKYLDLQYKQEPYSDELYLSDMAFWNPAELIGDRPNYLDYSIFNHLITKTNWNEALVPLGYSKVTRNLLEMFANKPYINVQHSFFSLLPEDLSSDFKSKLIKFYNKKIIAKPELHDKIEFKIAHNCYHFDADNGIDELLVNGFSQAEVDKLRTAVITLTNNIFHEFEEIIAEDFSEIKKLEMNFNSIVHNIKISKSWKEKLTFIYSLIEDCSQRGIQQFTRAARFAFIANSFLKSLREDSELCQDQLEQFISSISTVASDLDKDFTKIKKGKLSLEKFNIRYGHLRPGTYDITKMVYSKNKTYFSINNGAANNQIYNDCKKEFQIDRKFEKRINDLCKEKGIKSNANNLLRFIERSIQLRELFKFEYTKNISQALELIADVGEELGFTRDDLSYLDYYSITNNRNTACSKDEIHNIWENLISSRKEEKRINGLISLPALIYSEKDFLIVKTYNMKPNFITESIVSGEIVFPDKMGSNLDIKGKIVIIEKADPGYDWIFTKKIKGLITKYGGVASHMAIRCAEFNIPAAIGCGENIFTQISNSKTVILDCKNNQIDIEK